MKFIELNLKGAYLIEPEPNYDERGHFSRTFCVKEFENHGLVSQFFQCSTSFNFKKGLIRGLHYQLSPHQETKLVRCTRGAIFDVMVDLRKNSSTYMKWYGTSLTEENQAMLYIPKDFAHGFQVLEDNTEVFYMMDEYYHPELAASITFDSVEDEIFWPLKAVNVDD